MNQTQSAYFAIIFRETESCFQNVWGERNIEQINLSSSKNPGTIRGLHLQAPPHLEAKIVRCLAGSVWDVCVDLNQNSPTFRQWHAIVLSPELNNAIFIPEGCAHGWQALEPNSQLLYLHSMKWVPDAEIGIRYDDPKLALPWPLPPCNVSERDLLLPFIDS